MTKPKGTGTLSRDDRRLLEELFDRAADLPQTEHAAFIDRECGSNERLHDELERLLAGLLGDDMVTRSQPVGLTRLGTKIGPYTLQERIGEGGMGEVYAAEQSAPVVRRVALKLIKPGMDSAQVVTRFEAERQALARMTHPHVAQVFDGGTTDDGRPYFVMELVVGEPITEYCDRHALPTHERLELFLDVCKGVQHAHQKGLIHRDLKPSNLLVMQQDGRALPKIIDFGVARATTGSLADRTFQTLLGQVVGTLDYMSPEQADPSGVDIDTRSDVYSLGVVLYQLVSGLLPFDHRASLGKPISEIQREIRELDPPTPSTRLRRQTGTATVIAKQHGVDERALLRQLSGDLDWICLKALEKDPDRRYASVSDLEDDVRRHLAHEPVLAARPDALYRTRKFVRRHLVGVTAGTLVIAATIAGVVGTVSARVDAEDNADLADAARIDAELNADLADAARIEAEHNADLADAALVALRQASAPGRLELLKREADEALWPPKLDLVPAYDLWLGETRALVADLEPAVDGSYPGHRRQLAELLARSLPRTQSERQAERERHPRHAEWQSMADEAGAVQALIDAKRTEFGDAPTPQQAAWLAAADAKVAAAVHELDALDASIDTSLETYHFARLEDERAHQQLVALIDGLMEMSDSETGLIDGHELSALHGWSIQRRRDYAATLAERTLTDRDAQERWAEAIASIAESPIYNGLRLSPQLGLLPIGRDPESKLWEFAHVMSGEPAERAADTHRIKRSAEMGLVLVLVPGGAFTMGAQADDETQPNYDPMAQGAEGPPYSVPSLPSFFLSKYEMTTGQWRRFGTMPYRLPHDPAYALRPVRGITQVACEMITRRLGLALPTEEQWEYAARGGTTTIWWTGNEPGKLAGVENLYDQALFDKRPLTSLLNGGEPPFDWHDGKSDVSNVGSFPANPFGLHDVLGNVSEWCSSLRYDYSAGPDQPEEQAPDERTARGGNNRSGQRSSRPTFRDFADHRQTYQQTVGLRPSRAIDVP